MTSPNRIAGWQIAMAILGSCSASAHHAGGVGNALGAGPIITDPASTLDEGHSVAAVTLDYQSLGGLSTQTLLSATAAMPPGSPESNNVSRRSSESSLNYIVLRYNLFLAICADSRMASASTLTCPHSYGLVWRTCGSRACGPRHPYPLPLFRSFIEQRERAG